MSFIKPGIQSHCSNGFRFDAVPTIQMNVPNLRQRSKPRRRRSATTVLADVNRRATVKIPMRRQRFLIAWEFGPSHSASSLFEQTFSGSAVIAARPNGQ